MDPFFAPSIDHKIYEIDLHETGSISEALDFLDSQLFFLIGKEQYCKVIYGIGEGILRKEVLAHLKKLSYIKSVQEDSQNAGACLVLM